MGMGMALLLISGLCTCTIDGCGQSWLCFRRRNLSNQHLLCHQPTLPRNPILPECSWLYSALHCYLWVYLCPEPLLNEGTSHWNPLCHKRNIFQLFGVLFIYTPISVGCVYDCIKFPVCGFIYFLVNSLVVLIGLIAFIFVARRYKKRERDEPDNIYRYAEEYYANDQGESSIEYYNYDNLKVETIKK